MENTFEFFQEKFPELLKTQPSCGWSLPIGWVQLMYAIIETLDNERKRNIMWYANSKNPSFLKEATCWSTFQINQVKEKFGYLTIYTTGGPKNLYKEISCMAAISRYTCLNCGKLSVDEVCYRDDISQYWITYRCNSCWEVERERRENITAHK